MTGYVVGIDLGTSNTVAVIRSPDGRRRPVLFDGAPLMPSAVFLQDNGQLAVGRDAQRLAQLDPARYEPNPKRRIDETTVLLGNTEVPTREMLASVLRAVAVGVAEVARTPPPVVLTYPASWAHTRRSLLQEAAAAAGWRQVSLVPEPVAAARYFISALNHPLPRGAAMVVYDFGGGTIDIAVVRHDEAGFTVIGAGGLEDVGGLDIDATLVEHVGSLLRRTDPAVWQRLQHPVTSQDRRDRRLFWEDVRGAKEMLSRTATAPISVPGVESALHLTRDELEALVEPMLRQTIAETARVVASCKLAPNQLTGIMLVGGSSRVPLVARMLHRSLGIVPTVLEQPELPVAEGAVVHPAELAGAPATGTASVGGPPRQNVYQTQGYPAQQVTGHSGVVYGTQASAAVPVSPVSPVSPADAPVSAVPVSGIPVSAAPVSGSPVSAVPVSGGPVSAPPVPVPGAPAPPPGKRRRLALIAAAVVVLLLVAGGAAWWLTRPDLLGSWETLPQVPTKRGDTPVDIEGAGAAFLNDKLYIIGGYTADNPREQLNTVWVFDTRSGKWEPGPPLQSATTQMAVVVTPEKELYILGGYTKSGATANTYRLDGDTWREMTELPEPRLAGAAVWDGTTIIFAGGVGADGDAKDTIWKHEADGESWTVAGRLQHPRTKLTAGTDGAGTAWFIGGSDDSQTYADIDVLIKQTVTPSTMRLPEAREGASAVVLEGFGLCVLGGANGEKYFQWWCATSGVADRLPKLAVPRAGMAVTTTGSTVYAVGGYNTAKNSKGSRDAERFTATES
ncbi:Hsp70 family protein [Dactylosporangium sp. NBC_01737]|uniref:Hsp70 family protein n=1 Tax=Dactylosporangium sp. NBC_01737 TaxID=2975959 RepID=UPI002E10B82A|nr:Hsp70 family protein [Dactylosporangium sp. NBC_01737]